MFKVAYEFMIEISMDSGGSKEFHWDEEMQHSFASEAVWGHEALDFEEDIVNQFLECNEEIEKLEPGLYHVFEYGTMEGQTSWTEYGPEFGGWLFESEFSEIDPIPTLEKKDAEEN